MTVHMKYEHGLISVVWEQGRRQWKLRQTISFFINGNRGINDRGKLENPWYAFVSLWKLITLLSSIATNCLIIGEDLTFKAYNHSTLSVVPTKCFFNRLSLSKLLHSLSRMSAYDASSRILSKNVTTSSFVTPCLISKSILL